MKEIFAVSWKEVDGEFGILGITDNIDEAAKMATDDMKNNINLINEEIIEEDFKKTRRFSTERCDYQLESFWVDTLTK